MKSFLQAYLICLSIVWRACVATTSETAKSISYALYQKGIHYQYEVKDIQAAMSMYQEADRSITSWDKDHLDFSGMYNDLGVLYYNFREYDLAQKAYERVLTQHPQHVNAIANLASLKASLGDIEGADALYLRGSQLENVPLTFMHNYAVHLLNTGRREASLIILNRIVESKSTFYQSRAEIAKQLCMQDRMTDSYAQLELALADAAAAEDLTFFWQTYFVYITATPILFPTREYVETFRSFYLHNLYEALTLVPKNALLRPEENFGCSYLGYYLIYQGYVDLIPRQLFSSLLMHVSDATLRPRGVTSPGFEADVLPASAREAAVLHDKRISVGFLGVMQNLNPAVFRVLLLSVAGNMPDETCQQVRGEHDVATASAPLGCLDDMCLFINKVNIQLKYYEHVHGLPYSILGLSYRSAHVYLPNFHYSLYCNFIVGINHDIFIQSYSFADVIILPKVSLNPGHTLQQISDLTLDVLIFTEIGMTHDIYFLAHSRLAKRTLSFWGHAITSGIVDFAHILDNNAWTDESMLSNHRGGPDYFISSVLFEKSDGDKKSCMEVRLKREGVSSYSRDSDSNECYFAAQRKYSERLLLQEGMTTFFHHPPLPLTWLQMDTTIIPKPVVRDAVSDSRIPLLPDKLPFLAYFQSSGGRSYKHNIINLRKMLELYKISEHAIRLYCIPQTLYKLSPGNIDVIKKLLVADASGVLVLLDGEQSQPEQKQLIINEIPPSSLERIIFLRKLNQQEYMTLLALSDVVLDTFPVGGGRSSFAIFSTGTPIVMLYPATSILQLTYGMYQTMGFDSSMCITYDVETYIASSIEIASNLTLQRALRKNILKYKSRLFENKTVIGEWDHMLRYVMSVPRPTPFETASTSDAATVSVTPSDSPSIEKSALPISTRFLFKGKDAVVDEDNTNWLQDLHRIFESSQSQSTTTFKEWVNDLPLNITLAFSVPYSSSAIRLSSVETVNVTNIKGTPAGIRPVAGDECHAQETRQKRYSDFEMASYDQEGMTLGVILVDEPNVSSQTPQQKLQFFKQTIMSLKRALRGDKDEENAQFPFGNIKEVIVVDDGTLGMSVEDRALFSDAFPTFHFIFERTKTKTLSKKKKSWYQLKALSSLIKLSQHKYLFLIPSNLNATTNPSLSPLLGKASQNFLSPTSPPSSVVPNISTSFSVMLRFALQLLHGYSNVTSTVTDFSVKGPSDTLSRRPLSSHEQVFRQAAHIVLLNTLGNDMAVNTAQVRTSRVVNEKCLRELDSLVIDKITDGSHLLIEQCQCHLLPSNELHADAAAVPSTFYRRSPYCAYSVAKETYLDNSTHFGGFIDEDIRSICGPHLNPQGQGYLLKMDSIVDESYRDFTCLLAAFSPEARLKMQLHDEDVQYLKKIQNFYLQPSLWDVQAVSLLIQGLEKEFQLREMDVETAAADSTTTATHGTYVSTRFRHKQKPLKLTLDKAPTEKMKQPLQQKKKKKKKKRKTSLVRRSGRVDAVFHARAEVVFDRSEAFEYQHDNTDNMAPAGGSRYYSSSICQYINSSAIIESATTAKSGADDNNSNDLFHCGSKTSSSASNSRIGHMSNSARLVQRLLSSGVKIAYLSGELFEAKNKLHK